LLEKWKKTIQERGLSMAWSLTRSQHKHGERKKREGNTVMAYTKKRREKKKSGERLPFRPKKGVELVEDCAIEKKKRLTCRKLAG